MDLNDLALLVEKGNDQVSTLQKELSAIAATQGHHGVQLHDMVLKLGDHFIDHSAHGIGTERIALKQFRDHMAMIISVVSLIASIYMALRISLH